MRHKMWVVLVSARAIFSWLRNVTLKYACKYNLASCAHIRSLCNYTFVTLTFELTRSITREFSSPILIRMVWSAISCSTWNYECKSVEQCKGAQDSRLLCFIVVCYNILRVASQSYDCPSTTKGTLTNMGNWACESTKMITAMYSKTNQWACLVRYPLQTLPDLYVRLPET